MMLDLKEKGNLKKFKYGPQWGDFFKNLNEESKPLFGGTASRKFCTIVMWSYVKCGTCGAIF